MVVLAEGHDRDLRAVRIMFEGQIRTAPFLRDQLAAAGGVISVEEMQTAFVSLQTEAEDYANIVEWIGFDRAVSALRKLGDAVVARFEESDEVRLRLIDTDEFHIGILRSTSAYTAFRRGGRYLRRVPAEPVEDAASTFVLGTRLPSAVNPYVLRFDFEEDDFYRDRVGVIIGRNGVGKTQLLRSVVGGLASERVEDPQARRRRIILAPRPQASRVLLFSSVTSDPYPKSIPPWWGVDYEYFSLTAPFEDGTDALLSALAMCRRTGQGAFLVRDGVPYSRFDLLSSLLDDMAMWRGVHVPLKPAGEEDHFPQARVWQDRRYLPYHVRLNELDGIRFVQEIDWARAVLVFGADGRPRHLSSGETAMFRFAAQAVSAIEKGCLLLLDEPETHLHPNFISDFMDLLQELLTATNSAAIIATHSAYVVREVPKQRVRVLTLEAREISIDTPRVQTFGASIDTISQFVFGDTNMSHRYQDVLRKWVESAPVDITIEDIIEQYGPSLNPETLSFIARALRERQQGVVL
jgi:energy-coupling factor transporter ATP-binding protein EcfA2